MNFVPPSEHQVLVFLVQLAVLLALARLLGQACKRLGQPAVVGELAAGVVLGPSVLGRAAPDAFNWLFPADSVQSGMLFTVGWLGVMLLLVTTGFETDLTLIGRLGRAVLWVTVGSLVVPFAFGVAGGAIIPDSFLTVGEDRVIFALFLATALTISSLPVIATILADLRTARGHDESTTGRGAFHVHLGSGDWPVQLRAIDDQTALIDFEDPIATVVGERFIVRDAGRRAVVAGGRVLHPFPPRRRRHAVGAAHVMRPHVEGSPDELASALLSTLGTAPLALLAEGSGGGVPTTAVVAGALAVTPDRIASATVRAVSAARAHHHEHPLRDGIPKAELADAAGIPAAFIDHLIDGEDHLEAIGSAVAADGHRPQLTDAHEAQWKAARATLLTAGFGPPRASELIEDQELAHALIRRGDLVQVDEFLYLAETLGGLGEALATLDAPFTVSEAKDALGISRKHAVPLMEWCDATALTKRSGDGRVLRD